MHDDTPITTEAVSENVDFRRWTPEIGPETEDFLKDVVPKESRQNILNSAISILSKGISPIDKTGQETGLVIGYIQSGKTMSFETVTALARDNAFQLVILIAGISNPLLNQSADRLRRDLKLDDVNRRRSWIQFQNPSNDDTTIQAIRDVLEDWNDSETPEQYKKTVLITVLKNHNRLRNLTNLFNSLDMQGVPTLLIDDEADQASLNINIQRDPESTTYRRLMELRRRLTSHTYLQYTATPQAPLLVSIIDSLSPNFVQVLEPGQAYVGGQEFFSGNLNYVRVIPPQDVPTESNTLTEPPESLLEALRVFMVGVTADFIISHNTGNRSMLVHPSHLTAQHQEFYSWVRNIVEEWKRVLKLPDDDPDKLELIEEFRAAYNDLSETVGPDFLAFEELKPSFSLAFRNTRILEVNARSGLTPQVDWRSAYGWILVGGQAMDRGFTIEGLTVTYMPRGIGVGNADTIQQRARFFGYKKSYLGYCRIYLEQATLRAFQGYVEHEEDIRGQLHDVQKTGSSLNEWKRTFILDPALSPCRHQVLEFDYMRGRFSDQWVSPRIVLESDSIIQDNNETVNTFLGQIKLVDDEGHSDRTDIQRHKVCRETSLSHVIEQLLVRMRISGTNDSQRNVGLLLQLSRALDSKPEEPCTIYLMSSSERRRRRVRESGEIHNLYQGEAPVRPIERRGKVYPGDRKIRDNDTVSIQIHIIDLIRQGNVVKESVPIIAVWVPARLATSWIHQDQLAQGN